MVDIEMINTYFYLLNQSDSHKIANLYLFGVVAKDLFLL